MGEAILARSASGGGGDTGFSVIEEGTVAVSGTDVYTTQIDLDVPASWTPYARVLIKVTLGGRSEYSGVGIIEITNAGYPVLYQFNADGSVKARRGISSSFMKCSIWESGGLRLQSTSYVYMSTGQTAEYKVIEWSDEALAAQYNLF